MFDNPKSRRPGSASLGDLRALAVQISSHPAAYEIHLDPSPWYASLAGNPAQPLPVGQKIELIGRLIQETRQLEIIKKSCKPSATLPGFKSEVQQSYPPACLSRQT
jgi:hypothetical protein